MLNARIQEKRKASTSPVSESCDTIEGANLNPFGLPKLPNFDAKEDGKIEIAENIADVMENHLSSFGEDKDTINLIKINAFEFIEVQKKSEELPILIQILSETSVKFVRVEVFYSNFKWPLPLAVVELMNASCSRAN
ncbi:hypothetical protein NPIL_443811 [Nephila pilipes]|uniref:Uncharacterized protein n=1 Tax=Nephila pilipes TaxID=299642 RepID=A0A8X6MUW8_NEPPI|nr:hypothetical protein NPIL_443811 [Nephila pilipes]